MTPEEALEVLSQVTYRPGYAFTLKRITGGHALVIWQFDRPDSRNPENTLDLRYVGQIIDNEALAALGTDGLLRLARQEAVRLEIHETSEWLRYKGKLLMDPHDRNGARLFEYALDGALFDRAIADGER